MTNRTFLRHALVYGTTSLLTQSVGILLVPLFTRCLDKDQYGALEALSRAAELGGLLMLVSGLRQGLVTLYQQKESVEERRRTVGAALLLVTCSFLIVGGLVGLFASTFGTWLQEDVGLVILAFLAILIEPFYLLPLGLMQARIESTHFLVITVGQFLSRVSLSIVFVLWFGWGVMGVFGATALSGAVFAALLVGRELWHGVAWPDWPRVRDLLRFSLPFLPASLCFFVLQYGDRFILKSLHGNEAVATYSLGYKIAQAVSAFTLVPLQMVWTAHMYTAARRTDAPIVFGRAFTRILAVYLFVGLGVSVFENEAVRLFGGATYGAAIPVIAPVLLGTFFLSAAWMMDAAFYICHRTGLKLVITAATTVFMGTLYALWIPAYGSMGAALATMGGFAFLAICTWKVTQRFFPVEYEWRRLGGMVVLTGAFWLLSRLLPATPWALPLKALFWLCWPLLLWFLNLVSDEEKESVWSFLRRPFREESARQGNLASTAARS